jgi:hypothetical protein
VTGADAGGSAAPLTPFDLHLNTIARFLNAELADHPIYDGFELQHHDHPERGTGMLVFLSRRADRLVDYYVTPGLQLDRADFNVGAGTASWNETAFDASTLEVHPDGVVAEVRFRDVAGREIRIGYDDRDGRPRQRAKLLLAPVSAGIEQPTSMLFVLLHGFDLVRERGRGDGVHIDGLRVSTGSLPGRRLHHRELVKYAAPLTVVALNRQLEGSLPTRPVSSSVEVTAEHGVAALVAGEGDRTARFELDPALPDLRRLPEAMSVTGTWRLVVDGQHDLTGGPWVATRHGATVDLGLEVNRRWQPGPLPPIERLVTRVVPTFRRWPTTYRWRAAVDLDASTIRSGWERTGGDQGAVYRRLTRSGD